MNNARPNSIITKLFRFKSFLDSDSHKFFLWFNHSHFNKSSIETARTSAILAIFSETVRFELTRGFPL